MRRISRWTLTAVFAALLSLSAASVASADPYDPGTAFWADPSTMSDPYDPGTSISSNPYDPGVGE